MIEKTWLITEKLILNALHLTRQLYQQLIQEADTLKKSPHTELINDIAANKKHLVMQLEQFNMQCGQILATEKLPNNQEGIKEYFQQAEAAGLPAVESINNWTQIQFICSECRTMNETKWRQHRTFVLPYQTFPAYFKRQATQFKHIRTGWHHPK